MGKRPPAEPIVRKSVGLPASMWAEIDAVARTLPGKLPTEAGTLRLLVRRALDLFARPRWQPIETALRELDPGDQALVWDGRTINIAECSQWDGVWIAMVDGDYARSREDPDKVVLLKPTHWRPLPEPPGAD